jgi:hypothetical protein
MAPAAAAAPELPLLRHRFPDSRPALAMGVLAQKQEPIDLVIARDYRRHWPVPISTSCFDADKLFLMKTTFHPGQLLCGRADPDAVITQCYLFYVHCRVKSSNLFIPVVFTISIHRIILAFCIRSCTLCASCLFTCWE